jgi:hypothetical protein
MRPAGALIIAEGESGCLRTAFAFDVLDCPEGWSSMWLFSKGMLGGVAAVVIAWIAIVLIVFVRPTPRATGLVSFAGGWDALLRSPLIVLILAAAFGLGFWVMSSGRAA